MNSVEVASDHFENLTTKKYYITSNLMYAQGKDHSTSEGVGDLENKCPVSALKEKTFLCTWQVLKKIPGT